MPFKNGLEFVGYYSATPLADALPATIAAASWLVGRYIQTSENNRTKETSSFKIRGDAGSGGSDIQTGTAKSNEVTLVVAYNTDDVLYDTMENAFENDLTIAFADTDGVITTSGTKGIVGNYTVSQFNRSAPDGQATANVTLSATDIRNGQYRVA